MRTTTIDGLRILQSELLLAAGLPHGWFDSSLGNTKFLPDNPHNDPEWIAEPGMRERRARACSVLGMDGSRVVATSGLNQTDIIQILGAEHAGTTAGPADGYITNTPQLPIALAAGDCSQIIIYAPDVQAMAVVHAGGRATARGITTKAVQQLATAYGAAPAQMIVAIGPTIGPEHYIPTRETDGYTLTDIADTQPVTKQLTDGRIGYDIVASTVAQLQRCGVPAGQIEVSGIDTYTNPNWYSYERERERDEPLAMRRHGLFVTLPVTHSR